MCNGAHVPSKHKKTKVIRENAAKELRSIAKDRSPIKGQKTLHRLAKALGITGYSDWEIADQIPQICLDDVAKKPQAESIPYSHENRRAISHHIAETVIHSYASRKEHVASTKIQQLLCQLGRKLGCEAPRINPMQGHGCPDAITGVTEVSLKNFLGGSWNPLIDLIKQGKIKGIAGVVGCSSLRAKGHDVFTVELTKQLIKKDILVLSAGCTCGGLENTGLMSPSAAELAGDGLKEVCQSLGIPPVLNFGPCLAIDRMDLVCGEIAAELGVDFPQLPVVLSAPQWLEEQALADGAFALLQGGSADGSA